MSEAGKRSTAEKVFSIFNKAKQSKHELSTEVVWYRALGLGAITNQTELNPAQRIEVYTRLKSLRDALDEIDSHVRETNNESEATSYLRRFNELRAAACPNNLSQKWEISQHAITEAALTSLEFLAHMLPSEEPITDEELNVLKNEVADLITRVKQSDINRHLKKWTLHLLAQIEESINLYWIQGSRCFRAVLASAAGEFAISLDQFRELREKQPQIAKGLGGVITKCNEFLKRTMTNYDAILKITGPVVEHLALLGTDKAAEAAISAVEFLPNLMK